MRSSSLAGFFLCALSACSNTFMSQQMHLRWEAPSGVKLVEETAGPPITARFTDGFEMRLVTGELTGLNAPDEKQLEPLLVEALQRAGMAAVTGTPASMKTGSLPLGPVARYEVKVPPLRQLIYLVRVPSGFLVLSMVAPVADYVRQEAQFERSFASMTITH